MKSNTSRKWLGALALAFVMATLALQFGSARAQFGEVGFRAGVPYYAGRPTSNMVERDGYLYMMRGDVLYKIREKDLKVERRLFFTDDSGSVPTETPYVTTTPTLTPGGGTPTATPATNGM